MKVLKLGVWKKGIVTNDFPIDVSGADVEVLGCQLEARIRQMFGRSLAIREVDAGSCNGCEVEVNSLSNPVYDLERFGLRIVASPRHADMLLVTGPVTRNMESALRKTYDATPEPKLVVALGDCAKDGGIFSGSYAVTGGVGKVLPVDVYIPGCPPRPQAILAGIMAALDKMPRK
ncbi:MAG: NADH-quinone oxidoreductase subunit B family protein [Methanomassiliicoccales archaeon]|nr:NADH-quinone oxidoreductase subunit B family protein [Methanomassiliicoccales archaeon]